MFTGAKFQIHKHKHSVRFIWCCKILPLTPRDPSEKGTETKSVLILLLFEIMSIIKRYLAMHVYAVSVDKFLHISSNKDISIPT